MNAPQLLKAIPVQVINEQAAYGPFNLREYFVSETPLQFRAELQNGSALPKGMICTTDGVLTGIPAKGTVGNYEVNLHVANESDALDTTFNLTIKPSLADTETNYIDKLKAQVWQALEEHLPAPDISEMFEHAITMLDIYYLAERWATMKVWDVFNLDPPSEPHLLELPDASPHYRVYDRGSCIVMTPKDLFSDERTTKDGLQTAAAVAREIYKRGWTIEVSGFEKLTRALWIEIQHLGDKHGKQLEIVNYNPSVNDVKVYNTQAISMSMRRSE